MSDPSQALAAAAAQIAELQRQLGVANGRIADLETQNIALQTQLTAANQAKAQVDQQLSQAQGEIQRLSQQVSSLNSQIAPLEEQVRRSRADAANAIDAQKKTEAASAQTVVDLGEEKARSGALDKQVKDLNTQVAALQDQISKSQAQYTSAMGAQQRADMLQAELDAIKAPAGPGVTKTAPWFQVIRDGTQHPTELDAQVHIISLETGMSKAAAHNLIVKHKALDPTIAAAAGGQPNA